MGATVTYTPQLGDIGIVTIRGDVGCLIRLAQWLARATWKFWTWRKLWKTARREHAFIYVGDGRIVEAEPGPDGARLAFLSEYDEKDVLWLQCPDEFRDKVARCAKLLVGTIYSAADYFALAAHHLHVPVPGLREFIDASGHAMCSQLVDLAAQRGGWEIFRDGRWRGYVMPLDLAEIVPA